MTEKTNEKKIDVLSILNEAESTPQEARVAKSSSNRTTLFKSSLYKKGKRTETSLIDETIIEAVKASYTAGKTEVSFYALTRLFEVMNYRLRKYDRIASHVEAKKEIFSSFFKIETDKLQFKDSILIALELEVEKPQTKLRKKEA
jgi:hypothetical protein